MITLREAVSDTDLHLWRDVRFAISPGERTATVAELRAMANSGRVMLLAEEDGVLVGSGVANSSDLTGGSLCPGVLHAARRRGIGTVILDALAGHCAAQGHARAGCGVEDEASLAFAHRFGFTEVDRQVEQHQGKAENGYTAVRREWRGRGVAAALKRTTLAWAASHGVTQIQTWTQRGNDAMRALNERLGYRMVSIRVESPLPLSAR